MITKDRIKHIRSMLCPIDHLGEDELLEILELALKGLAAEKLEKELFNLPALANETHHVRTYIHSCDLCMSYTTNVLNFNDALSKYRKEIGVENE